VGRNGAGKTTLIRTLLGLVHPDAGRVALAGHDASRDTPHARRAVGYVGEGEVLPVWATLRALCRLERALRAEWAPEALATWAAAQGIGDRSRAGALSKGQRKRLELELALAGRPVVLLLDEPFAGLDPLSRADVVSALVAHVADRAASVLISTHALGDVERLCDRVGFLAGGRIAAEASVDELKEGGAVLVRTGDAVPDAPPVAARVLGTRQGAGERTWVLCGLDARGRAQAAAAGFEVYGGDLERLGVELLHCLGDGAPERAAARGEGRP
jgi:ABC-2 type transport system ATP-binding protein